MANKLLTADNLLNVPNFPTYNSYANKEAIVVMYVTENDAMKTGILWPQDFNNILSSATHE